MKIFKPHILQGLSAGSEGKSRHDCFSKHDIHKLSSNENLLGVSPKALKAISSNLNKLNEYPDNTSFRLKNALSEAYNFR